MKANDFDRRFDAGEDVTVDLELSKAMWPEQDQRRVHVAFPSQMIESLDCEAQRLGATRQSVIKVQIAEGRERKGA